MEAAPPATPRHPNPPLWLLPSGPDQVHGLLLRGDQQGHHDGVSSKSQLLQAMHKLLTKGGIILDQLAQCNTNHCPPDPVQILHLPHN